MKHLHKYKKQFANSVLNHEFAKLFKEMTEKDSNALSIDQIEEIDKSKGDEINTKFSTYLAEGSSSVSREPTYCKELGFAMEKLKDGYNLKDLWEVIPTTN